MLIGFFGLVLGLGATGLLGWWELGIVFGFFGVPMMTMGAVEYVTDKPFKSSPSWVRGLVILFSIVAYIALCVLILSILFSQE